MIAGYAPSQPTSSSIDGGDNNINKGGSDNKKSKKIRIRQPSGGATGGGLVPGATVGGNGLTFLSGASPDLDLVQLQLQMHNLINNQQQSSSAVTQQGHHTNHNQPSHHQQNQQQHHQQLFMSMSDQDLPMAVDPRNIAPSSLFNIGNHGGATSVLTLTPPTSSPSGSSASPTGSSNGAGGDKSALGSHVSVSSSHSMEPLLASGLEGGNGSKLVKGKKDTNLAKEKKKKGRLGQAKSKQQQNQGTEAAGTDCPSISGNGISPSASALSAASMLVRGGVDGSLLEGIGKGKVGLEQGVGSEGSKFESSQGLSLSGFSSLASSASSIDMAAFAGLGSSKPKKKASGKRKRKSEASSSQEAATPAVVLENHEIADDEKPVSLRASLSSLNFDSYKSGNSKRGTLKTQSSANTLVNDDEEDDEDIDALFNDDDDEEEGYLPMEMDTLAMGQSSGLAELDSRLAALQQNISAAKMAGSRKPSTKVSMSFFLRGSLTFLLVFARLLGTNYYCF
jgi:hypothetical protein